MLYKFFKAHCDFSVNGDCTMQCKEYFDIPANLEYFEGKSQDVMKRIINRKRAEYALDKFLKMKITHSKMDNLHYFELKMQSFLRLEDLSVDDSQVILKWRLRMAKFGTNYGEKFKLCPLCKQHEDSQEACFKQCQEIRTTEVITCNYEDIFKKP